MWSGLASGVVILCLLAASCGGGGEEARAPLRGPLPEAAPKATALAGPAALRATLLTDVPEGTFGPYVGVRAEGIIVAWASEDGGEARQWYATGLDRAFAPLRDAAPVTEAPAEIDLVAVRPLGTKAAAGFVLLQTSRDFSGARIDAMALDLDGSRKGGPSLLAQSLPGVVWLDAVATDGGGVALWAVPREGKADLFALALGVTGEPRGEPGIVLGDVTAWQVAALRDGVAVAAVAAGKGRGEPGPVELVVVDPLGKAGPRRRVSESPTADADLDMVRVGESLVLAWSDRRDLEPRIFGAVTDLSGAVTRAPSSLVPPFGPQALLRLVPPVAEGKTAYLAWENTLERSAGARGIRVAPLGAGGVTPGRFATLDLAALDGTVPEMAATGAGLAAMTLAPACRRGGECVDGAGTPTFVELDDELGVKASEPMRLDANGGELADLVWGLTCREEGCMSLAAGRGSPAPVYSVTLGRLSDDWLPAARKGGMTRPPRAETLAAVGVSDPVGGLAAQTLAGDALRVAWVTYFDPSTPFTRSKTQAPDGKYEPPRAVLRMLEMGGGSASGKESVLSYRADSRGGVLLAPSTGDESLLVWTGIDARVPQVFLTLVGPGGKKIAQKMLTRTKSGVSDLAVAPLGDGWVVAWVDQTGGTSRARVVRVDRKLRPVATERGVGMSPAGQSDVALLVQGTGDDAEVVVAWSATSGGETGAGEVVVLRLSARDLSPLGKEQVITRTPGHSRAPVLSLLGSKVALAWLEDGPGGAMGASSVQIALLSPSPGVDLGEVATLMSTGSVEAASLSCDADRCRILASVSEGPGGKVEAFEWSPDGTASAADLVRLESRPRDAVAPVLVPGGLLYADATAGSGADRGRVRRLGVTFR